MSAPEKSAPDGWRERLTLFVMGSSYQYTGPEDDEAQALAELRADIRAALGSWPPMRPMEDAPRDGTDILLRLRGSRECLLGYWPRTRPKAWETCDGEMPPRPDSDFAGWYPLPEEK